MSLHEYKTGEYIRPATEDEAFASDAASLKDGGAGVIIVEINGIDVSCYVVE